MKREIIPYFALWRTWAAEKNGQRFGQWFVNNFLKGGPNDSLWDDECILFNADEDIAEKAIWLLYQRYQWPLS